MLLSAANDCSIRCWSVEDGDAVQCVHTERDNPPMSIGGTRKGDAFFSFSRRGVDFWSIRNLYTLHCALERRQKAPLRQILVTSFPAPFPTRVLCVSGDGDISLVAAETGALLTSFRVEQRVSCADYCLQKEILLALTDTGTLLQANTLTNPVTLMNEWRGRGQGPWQRKDHVTEEDAQNLPVPGAACCMVLYCHVRETQNALEEWRSLQDGRGSSQRKKKDLHDDKNIFLIVLGHAGGCVSVLRFSDGKVMCRTPAHNGQRVTATHVYPEHSYLLTTGEDLTLVVWKVNPFFEECLSLQVSLHCALPQVHLAALVPRLVLTHHDPSSGTYKLVHLNLLQQSPAEAPPPEGHSDHITGVCVCPDLDVCVSCSLDRTVCVWSEQNKLLSTLQMNAEPQSLASSGFGGELFLGIRGDLYRMDCSKFLPHIYQQMLLHTFCAERVSDFPVIQNQERKIPSVDGEEGEELKTIGRNVSLSRDVWRQRESDMDLSALIEGSVRCRKEKPRSTKETKREAFDHYMKILYGLPLHLKIDLGDTFDPMKRPFNPEYRDYKPHNPPAVKKAKCADSKGDVPVTVEMQKKAPETKSTPTTPMSVLQRPAPKVKPKKVVDVEKREGARNPPQIIPPIAPPKPKTPTPHPRRQKPVPPPPPPPLPPRGTTPEVPMFLKQFTEADWFKDLFPDQKCISNILSPEDFSLQLLVGLTSCSPRSKVQILAALRALHSQRALPNAHTLSQRLVHLLPTLMKPHMSDVERSSLVELLYLLMQLKCVDNDLGRELLTLLAFKKSGLRDTALGMLTAAGVHEAEEWLWPELESWDSELWDPSNIWKHLHHRADCWLELWISKYKVTKTSVT
ncbi:WD repeat-containing protein 97 isoform X2 [Labrus bergylta]